MSEIHANNAENAVCGLSEEILREEIPAEPRITAETASYLVVYKPPRMHTAPGGKKSTFIGQGKKRSRHSCPSGTETLLDWTLVRFPEIARVRGHRENEGGLLHRLDYETRGLVLFARTQEAWDSLAAQQGEGKFIKEYEALSLGAVRRLPGFPPFPAEHGALRADCAGKGSGPEVPFSIESAFRSYGPGAKQVRPVPSHSREISRPGESCGAAGAEKIYRTEGIMKSAGGTGSAGTGEGRLFRLRLAKGFRHQIRCHLAWALWPLANDALYGGVETADCSGFLALRASALYFDDPLSGEGRKHLTMS